MGENVIEVETSADICELLEEITITVVVAASEE